MQQGSTMNLEPEDAEELEEQLHKYDGLKHLRVKKWGESMVIWSGGTADPQKHAKLAHLGRDIWNLSFPKHTGRWEKTPFTGRSQELVEMLVSNFSFYLEKW
jgi:hypothetical protein